MKRAMVDGTIGFIHCWDGDVLMAMDQLKDEPDEAAQLHYVLPEEGYARWCDGLTVPVGNNSRYGAHLFMDYLMDPQVAGKNASWVWYLAPIIPASWEYTDPFALTLKPTDEELARSEQFTDVGDFAVNYGEAWREVKSA
jgi:spermidine/putrescine transport system substrate-binding protein